MDLDPLSLLANADPYWMILSLVPSGAGFVLFVYGRKQARTPHLVAGILFMVYPMLATTTVSLLVGGIGIAAGLWYAIRLGW